MAYEGVCRRGPVTDKMGNIFENLPDVLHSEVFELLAEGGDVRVERIVSGGHTSPDSGWYDQDKSEWVIVLRGQAVIVFPDKPSVTLGEGDYLDIAAHEKHRVDWTDPAVETIWLAVHYRGKCQSEML